MDSSNAEKAWAEYWSAEWASDPSVQETFMAGRESRDAEVAELREQLAAAEAALAKGREWLDADVLHSHDQWADLFTAPLVVLEDRDRENRAIGWDEGERHESEYLSEWGQFCPGEHCNPYRGDKK